MPREAVSRTANDYILFFQCIALLYLILFSNNDDTIIIIFKKKKNRFSKNCVYIHINIKCIVSFVFDQRLR